MAVFIELQEWIEKAREIGELKEIEGADPHLEVGTMVQIDGKNEGPALLFSKLKGYSDSFKILTKSVPTAS